ncbi:MAG: hypothetical protein BWY44_00148 [Candidatus Omnitrophica bacterium ADurb.Bin292]|nr:MAG: hypothetical protein BWY44_00148 [Candidatus Omnitrophica bacterium ADurb.Bin292]
MNRHRTGPRFQLSIVQYDHPGRSYRVNHDLPDRGGLVPSGIGFYDRKCVLSFHEIRKCLAFRDTIRHVMDHHRFDIDQTWRLNINDHRRRSRVQDDGLGIRLAYIAGRVVIADIHRLLPISGRKYAGFRGLIGLCRAPRATVCRKTHPCNPGRIIRSRQVQHHLTTVRVRRAAINRHRTRRSDRIQGHCHRCNR